MPLRSIVPMVTMYRNCGVVYRQISVIYRKTLNISVYCDFIYKIDSESEFYILYVNNHSYYDQIFKKCIDIHVVNVYFDI